MTLEIKKSLLQTKCVFFEGGRRNENSILVIIVVI